MSNTFVTVKTARRFAARLMAISPRAAVETAVVTLGLSAFEGIGLLLLVPLLQLVGVDAQQGPLTRIVNLFGSAFHAVGLQPTLGVVLLTYVAIVALQAALQRRQTLLAVVLEQNVVSATRTQLYRAIAGMRWSEFARLRSSHFTQKLTDDVGRLGAAAYHLIDVIVAAVTSLVYVVLAYRVSPAMTALVLVCGSGMALARRNRIGEARMTGTRHSNASGRLYDAISEHLGSLKLAKGYGVVGRHADLFERLSRDVSDVTLANVRSFARLRQELAIGSAAVLAAIVYVSYQVLAISTAQLLLLLFLFARLVPRLTTVYEKVQALAAALPAFAAVSETERQCLAAAEPRVDRAQPIDLTRAIHLDRVTFAYDDTERAPAVGEVSLTIAAGSTTAIVGPSGAGKSTIADLLLGLLTPVSGTMLIDDVALSADRMQSWRERIGYVPQEAFLFHDTVRANLLWAAPSAGEDDLWRALRLAAADEFVAALPLGLDTVVGDRGVLVSGGERQRLSLARALLRHPMLLILDEATSSLDSESEARIQRAIDDLHRQMTIVIITHRLSTIRSADLIHVIERGRLVESGTWAELTDRAGRFRELCDAQGVTSQGGAMSGLTAAHR